MITAAVSALISVIALFVSGHYLLALTLMLLNLLLGTYLLYGKLLSRQVFEKPEFPKDINAIIASVLVTAVIYCLISLLGDRSIVMNNSELMLVAIYILLLAIAFVTIKIQKEEKR